MNKTHFRRLITVSLLIFIVVSVFSGCSILSMLDGGKTKETVFLEGSVVCYASPDINAEIVATFSDGLSVSYEEVLTIGGVQWAEIGYGWVILGTQEETTAPPVAKEGVVTAKLLNVRSGPGEDHEQLTQIPTGTKVTVTEISEDALWGKTEQGWIYLGHLYFLDDAGSTTGHAVVREKKVTVYDSVGDGKESVKTLKTGARVEILELVSVDGQKWGYTKDGWMPMEFLYLEGEPGKRPCSGIVIDSTPLNVRSGPSTKFSIITSLPYGTHVEVMERIKCNGNDWGFNGTGWIYMKNVDIQ